MARRSPSSSGGPPYGPPVEESNTKEDRVMPKTLRRSRRLAATAALTCGLLLTGLAGTALASDYDGDGVATPADCKDLDPAVHPGAVDKPDLTFEDTNCDGIDGDKAKAIFVAPNGDNNGTGSLTNPKKTLGGTTGGIATAKAQGKDVYLAGGTYNE